MAVHRQSCVGATGLWSVYLLFIVTIKVVSGASLSREDHREDNRVKSEAIERLSEVFRFRKLPEHTHHRTPPQYMVDLYHAVADTTGITKTSTPFDADVIRGFPDRGNIYYFVF